MELVLVDKSNYKEAIRIQNEIFPKENGALNILASLDRDFFIKNTGFYYPDDKVKYYLAKIDNSYVGITGIYYYDLESAWLGWFGILNSFKQRGFGTELLNETIELAKSKGFKYLRLYTDYVDNHNAINLYEKLGFVGELYTFEKLPYDCRIYSKSLSSNELELWNNKNLDLGYQTELDHMTDEKIYDIIKLYDDIL